MKNCICFNIHKAVNILPLKSLQHGTAFKLPNYLKSAKELPINCLIRQVGLTWGSPLIEQRKTL